MLQPDIPNLLAVSLHSRRVNCCLQASCRTREALVFTCMNNITIEPAGFLKIDFSGLAGVYVVFSLNV